MLDFNAIAVSGPTGGHIRVFFRDGKSLLMYRNFWSDEPEIWRGIKE